MPAATPAADRDDPRISAQDLAAFLAGQYADAGWSRTDHYAWISGLLLELGITSLDELGRPARPVDSDALNDADGLPLPAGAVRRLDDALLAVFGERYVGLTATRAETNALAARLPKLLSPCPSPPAPLHHGRLHGSTHPASATDASVCQRDRAPHSLASSMHPAHRDR